MLVLGIEGPPPTEEPSTDTAIPVTHQTLVAGAIAAADTGEQESAAELYRSYPPAPPPPHSNVAAQPSPTPPPHPQTASGPQPSLPSTGAQHSGYGYATGPHQSGYGYATGPQQGGYAPPPGPHQHAYPTPHSGNAAIPPHGGPSGPYAPAQPWMPSTGGYPQTSQPYSGQQYQQQAEGTSTAFVLGVVSIAVIAGPAFILLFLLIGSPADRAALPVSIRGRGCRCSRKASAACRWSAVHALVLRLASISSTASPAPPHPTSALIAE